MDRSYVVRRYPGFRPAHELSEDALYEQYELMREFCEGIYMPSTHLGLSYPETIIARTIRKAGSTVSTEALQIALYHDRDPDDWPESTTITVFVARINAKKKGRWRIRSKGGARGFCGYFMDAECKAAFDNEAETLLTGG